MKTVLINGSPRKNGNTYQALSLISAELEANGVETKIIQLGGHLLYGCQSCNKCRDLKNRRCAYNDYLNEIMDDVFDCDCLVIGSPTYYSNVSTEVKAFIDRVGRVAGANGNPLKGKLGAPVVSVRRAGGNFVYSAINFFFGILEMPIVTSSYWNMTLSRDITDFSKDDEGIRTFKTLSKNIYNILTKLSK
jgi:multimeric flavodoxin WrbA